MPHLASVPITTAPRYEAFGWDHWPDYPILSYQFRRGLGETQEGGGAVGECLLAASRMIPGDYDSWHDEWLRIATENSRRAEAAERAGHPVTARNCWLRAMEYFRQAEFFLEPADPRRLETFSKLEAASHHMLALLDPPGEVVEIPYEGTTLSAYFVKPSGTSAPLPVLISLGGLDSFKDELWFMQARGALQRGLGVLMVDGPGQGAPLRRQGLRTRYDYEVPVGACVDYLEARSDVDRTRIAVCGSSLGGYYAARAASFERRLAACISHGVPWFRGNALERLRPITPLHMHFNWVFGCETIEGTAAILDRFQLAGVIDGMKCPYLIANGAHDILGREDATAAYEYAREAGLDVTLRLTNADETGADHCHHDNPTLGQEIMLDWLTDRLGIAQRASL